MVPAYTLPPKADHVKIMRTLVKLTLGRTLATTLAGDLVQACQTLSEKGGLHEIDRRRAIRPRGTEPARAYSVTPVINLEVFGGSGTMRRVADFLE